MNTPRILLAWVGVLVLSGVAEAAQYGPSLPEPRTGPGTLSSNPQFSYEGAPSTYVPAVPARQPTFTENPQPPASLRAPGGGLDLTPLMGTPNATDAVWRSSSPPKPLHEDTIRHVPADERSAWDWLGGIHINTDPLLDEIPDVNDAARATGVEKAILGEMTRVGRLGMPTQGGLARLLSLARWYNRCARVTNAFWQQGLEGGMMSLAREGIKMGAASVIRPLGAIVTVAMLELALTTAPYAILPAFLAASYVYNADQYVSTLIDDLSTPPAPYWPGKAKPARSPPAPRPTGRPITAPPPSLAGPPAGGGSCPGGPGCGR